MTRIAVIEDDSGISRLIRDALRESGHETISYFQPSTDILEHLKNYQPDLVILDLRLNDSVNGWDIITALKQEPSTRSTPIIVCSAASKQIEENRAWLQELGVPVVAKPFDLDELDALVDQMLVSQPVE